MESASCEGRNRTTYLQVMSLASYRCSTSPVHILANPAGGVYPQS